MVNHIILLFTFIACNSPTEKDVQKIEIGMGIIDTEKKLGEPIVKIPDEGGAIWIYYYPYKSYNKRMDVYVKDNEVSEIIIY